MKKATLNTLKLHRETLRSLTTQEIGAVAGGVTKTSICATLSTCLGSCGDPTHAC
jgi:hypothetical protein